MDFSTDQILEGYDEWSSTPMDPEQLIVKAGIEQRYSSTVDQVACFSFLAGAEWMKQQKGAR